MKKKIVNTDNKKESELRGLINDFKVFVYEHGNNQKMQEKLKRVMTLIDSDEEPVEAKPIEVTEAV
jgi:hypothetical protein